MRRASLAIIPFLVAAASGSAALHAEGVAPQGTPLNVTVTGLHSARGRLVACLWTDKETFPSCEKSKTARRLVMPVSGKTMQFSFPHVTPGRYAVTVHHDEDGDGKMKHNFIGMPKEGVGVSKNPGGMPGFTKSLIDVGADSAITIRMRYLFG